MWIGVLALLAAALLVLVATPARALTTDEAHAISAGDSESRLAALQRAAEAGDARLPALVQALLDGAVQVDDKRAYIVAPDGSAVEAASGAAATLPETVEDVSNNNRMRGELQLALAALKLRSPEIAERRAALLALRDGVDESKLSLVERALASETDPTLKGELAALRAGVLVSSGDVAKRLEAARALGESSQPVTRSLLLERLKPAAAGGETDAAVRAALAQSERAISGRLAWGERLGVLFSGISLGSILLLAALGLAISYGLMGVINMAHGELMMIGAYATYVVQNLFRTYAPGAFDAYILVAIPVAFLAAAAVGAVLERGVIRYLYGRPLETLLATWGISLVLMQAVRSVFGAQNVQVENPGWLSGGWQITGNLVLPWNRIAIVVFAFAVLAAVALVIARTRLGLFVRGVTQNRAMAACTGVDTRRVDLLAFSLGAGIAGLAGCALSQVGNVGPDLGQSYIVDSFLVVVLGGVGQLAGTVYAALGLGVLNKLLEGWAGAVLAKIMVLLFIVVFIQKRPQGLFAMKGRSAEA
ncbi:urea ABC transporter permease subunit UrtB [Rivibacter subsaxonicus]|uniref:urea ABC transporter permease subunit UrtB n=1 Tax=Rivibacter subsaxonicus TaxID=457575 RepID=UPI00102B2E72|nr:urea ABC transporter permease subunit UrtB [Rivibacter subsaxonicus]